MRKRSSGRKRFNLKAVFIPLFIIMVLAGGLYYGWWFMHSADYFKVEEIIVRGGVSPELAHLRGRSIFDVDLSRESGYLLESYPDFSQVKMVRVLPNRIFVDFLKRNPVALIKLYREFAIDEEGVLFYALDETESAGLPVIVGLETKLFGPKPGKQYSLKELNAALKIIRYAAMNQTLKQYSLDTIDVTHPSQTSFILTKGPSPDSAAAIEVRIGLDSIRQRVAILGGLLRESDQDFERIKYIDLRFKDPVIKFKEDA